MHVQRNKDGSTTIHCRQGDPSGAAAGYAAWLKDQEDLLRDLRSQVKRPGADGAVATARMSVLMSQLERREKTSRILVDKYGPTERREVRGLPMATETRTSSGVREASTAKLVGYASRFFSPLDPGTQYQLAPQLVERVALGAFDHAIRDRHDVRALVDHNPSLIVARTKSGTLKLSTDAKGLRYEASLPSDYLGERVQSAVGRGDVSGSSFGFQIVRQRFEAGAKTDIRWIEDVVLLDVSPVSYPAYSATSAVIV